MYQTPIKLKPSGQQTGGSQYSKSHLVNSRVYIEVTNGIIMPDYDSEEHKKECLSKIRYTIPEIKKSIDQAKKDNKYILMLPGSFDLLHLGHVAYIEKSIETFCQRVECERDEVFVVVLTDDDELIRNVKAYKHVNFGGNEAEHRPVENIAERLVSLSAVDGVDIVGIIPSPTVRKDLLNPVQINVHDLLLHLIDTYKPSLEANIKSMELDKKIELKYLLQAHNDIEDLKTGLIFYNFMQKNWESPLIINYPVQTWQLYIMGVINNLSDATTDNVEAFKRAQITRFVNTEDVKYLHQVHYLMNIANIGITLFEYKIPEKSTSETIAWAISKSEKLKVSEKMSPWEIIRKQKKEAFDQKTYEDYSDAVSIVKKKLKSI